MNLRRERPSLRLEWALLGLLIGLHLFISTRQISRPGLWWDEGDVGAYGMELALDLPRTPTDWSVRFAGRSWPLRMLHQYDFVALPIYWSALAFKIGTVNATVLRLSAVLLGAAALAVFYALCRFWLGPRAAFAGGLLLAVNPSFALTSRLGYFALEIPLALPTLASLALLSLWHRQRRAWALYAGAFCWGLSTNVTTKSVAFLLAYPILYLALVPRKEWPSPRRIAAAASCAAFGAANFIAYNVGCGMPIIKSLLASLATPTSAGVDNSAVAQNIARRGAQILPLLNGSLPAYSVGGGVARDWILPIFAAAACAAMIWRGAAHGRFRGRGFILLVLALIVLLFLETAFTPRALDPQHLLVLLPYVFLPVAAALDWLRTEVERRLPGKGTLAAAALLALPVVSALRTDESYFSRLKITGGAGFLSDAIYDLDAYLDQNGIRRPVCLSWGISRNTYLITAGRVEPIEGHRYRSGINPWLRATYASFVRDPDARFISLADDSAAFPGKYLEALRSMVENSGRRLMIEKEFPDKQGRTVFIVWRVKDGA